MTYYTMRKNNPDIYENLTPRRVINVLDEGVIGVLNNRAPDGSKVIVFKPGIVKNFFHIFISSVAFCTVCHCDEMYQW